MGTVAATVYVCFDERGCATTRSISSRVDAHEGNERGSTPFYFFISQSPMSSGKLSTVFSVHYLYPTSFLFFSLIYTPLHLDLHSLFAFCSTYPGARRNLRGWRVLRQHVRRATWESRTRLYKRRENGFSRQHRLGGLLASRRLQHVGVCPGSLGSCAAALSLL